MVSTGFFLALIMLYTLANLGVFSLKSQVKIAGKDTCIFWRPKSTSLVTSAVLLSEENLIAELNVAVGMPINEPRI
jgi:hypothetical protein